MEIVEDTADLLFRSKRVSYDCLRQEQMNWFPAWFSMTKQR